MRLATSLEREAGSAGFAFDRDAPLAAGAIEPGPLRGETRTAAERTLGADLGDVRVHTGPDATAAARQAEATAFAFGTDIVFGARDSASFSQSRQLLGHELAHVVQQRRLGTMVQRQPEAQAPASQGPGRPAVETPEVASNPPWMKLTSEQGILPGDRIPGITDANRRYTDEDRSHLRIALRQRLALNKGRAPKFLETFSSGLVHVWTAYATQAVAEAAEKGGWSFLAKAASFAGRAVLLTLFPEELIVELVAEFGMETASEKAEEHFSKVVAVERTLEKLEEQAPFVAATITAAITPLMNILADGISYSDWLESAPLSELSLFRIPPLIPTLNESAVRTMVAQQLAGFAHEAESPRVAHGQQNVIETTLRIRQPGVASPTFVYYRPDDFTSERSGGRPRYRGPAALRKPMAGALVRTLLNVPLHVTLLGEPGALPEFRIDHPLSFPWGQAYELAASYETPFGLYTFAATTITRTADGVISVADGNLTTHLHLYQRVHPDADIEALIAEFARGINEPVSPQRTPKVAARELANFLAPSLYEG
ncbi:MAG: hypothetical protein QOD43_1684, partial [Gaiellaceae bacterium]|nr:hypothetical protein [Gaiellaceae bacterium]